MTQLRSSAPPQQRDGVPTTPHSRTVVHPTSLVIADAIAAAVAMGIAGASASGAAAFVAAVLGLDLLYPYRPGRLNPSALDDLPSVAVRGFVVAAILPVAGLAGHDERWGAAGPLIAAGCYAGLAMASRGLAYAAVRRLRASGRLARSAVIVGTGTAGEEIAWLLRSHPECGLRPVGFVDTTSAGCGPLLGDVSELPHIIAERGISHVFVAFTQTGDRDLVAVMRACQCLDCEVFVVPRLYELGLADHEVDHLWGLPLVRIRRKPGRELSWTVKRAADRLIAAIALVLAAPVLAAVAVAVRLGVGPGVLFRQVRVGLDGRLFLLVKFRTMRPPRPGERSAGAAGDAQRISPVGRFLRRSSLDELPQLWNVVRGEMSLVGPRPEQPLYVAEFVRQHAGYHSRLRVPAGITGWAQIHDLRGDTSIEERVRFDNFYIDHWSLWRDVKILIATAGSVLGLRGR